MCDKSKKKCLVTGGAGFIGSHLTESLLNDGHEVFIIDNLSTGDLDNISHLKNNSNLKFLEADILNCNELDSIVSNSDVVFHLAAAVGVELVVNQPVHTIETNVHGTEKILKSAEKNKTRILMASTSEVYGKSDKEVFSEEDDLLIGPSNRSRWSYACSKLLDEFYCMAFYRSIKLPVVIARLFNTVGPRQTGKYGMVVPRFVEKALKGDNLQVFGSGDQTRCFCHVSDTVRALKKLIFSEFSGEVFNVGSEHNVSIKGLADLTINRLNSRSQIEYVSYDKAYEPGFEDMLHRFPNIKKIEKYINWSAKHSLEKIIDDVADSLKK